MRYQKGCVVGLEMHYQGITGLLEEVVLRKMRLKEEPFVPSYLFRKFCLVFVVQEETWES